MLSCLSLLPLLVPVPVAAPAQHLPPAQSGSHHRALGDLIAGPYDVETAIADIYSFGVEEAWGVYWTTSRGTGGPGTQQIHKWDHSGNYVASYPQTVSASWVGGFGGMDMEADEANNLLFVGNSGGEIVIMDYDPITQALSYNSTASITGYTGIVRGLCRNPNNGNFFTKSYTADLIEFDLATGTILNQFVNTLVSTHGLGWDPVTNAIWATDFQSSATEIDPASGAATGRFINTGAMGGFAVQGGCDVYDDARNPNTTTLVMLGQGLSGTQDQIAAYDALGSGPPAWNSLPTTFVAANNYSDGFDSYLGVLPAHMTVTMVDNVTGLPDPEAWCNMGQLGPPLMTFSPPYALEMGLLPGSANTHYVRNGLILGLDGSGTSSLHLDFQVAQHNEEDHYWDGVWLSDDGLNWTAVYQTWDQTPPDQWAAVTGLDLHGSGVNLSGNFYLLFAQVDNFPVGTASCDGVHIDDIEIYEAVTGPTITITNLVAGQTADLDVVNCTPGGLVYVGYSFAGAGPTNTPFGPAELSQPYTALPFTADPNGEVHHQVPLPPILSGRPVWVHGADVQSATLTNPLALVIT